MKLKRIVLFVFCLVSVGIVAGCQNFDIPQDSSSENVAVENEIPNNELDSTGESNEKGEEFFRFVVLGDSHGDSEAYPRLLSQIKTDNPAFLVHVGDLTRVGGLDELKEAKELLDKTGMPYHVIPGDHDIVRAGGLDYFEQVFGEAQSYFDFDGWRFVLIDNSDTEKSWDESSQLWLRQALDTSEPTILCMHYPIEHPLLTTHTMEESIISSQNAAILKQDLQTSNVKQIFAGEMHMYSQYTVSQTKTPLTVVGAAGEASNPSVPQYVLVLVYNTGAFEGEQKLLTN